MPTFSIIIPAYNAEAYLSRCLDSIFSQEFEDYEVVVINDGSTDDTAELLVQYAARHTNLRVITQSNQGMATARNRGLEVAQSDYLMFVDSDDRLCSNALATLAPQVSGEDVIGFGTQIYNESTGNLTDNPIRPTAATTGWEYFNHERLIPRPVHFVCIWQRVYRRAFLEENNLRFVDGLRRAEDDLFTTMNFLHAQSAKTIADCLYIYHVRDTSITRSDDPKLDADSWRVQQILADTFIPMQGIEKKVIYQVLASNYINHLLNNKNPFPPSGALPLGRGRVKRVLSPTEWEQFCEVCVTPRHRRLYHLAHISPSLLQLYLNLCFLRQLSSSSSCR